MKPAIKKTPSANPAEENQKNGSPENTGVKTRKKRAPSDPNETRGDKFVRVVTPRVNKAAKFIDLIGHCSGPAYEYESKAVDEIVTHLHSKVTQLENVLRNRKPSTGSFKLS